MANASFSVRMSTVFRVFSYLRRYPLLATLQLVCAVLMTVLVIVFPGVTQTITSEVIPQRDFGRVLPLTALALGTFFATNLFNSLRIILNNTFEQRVIFDIRSDLYEKIQRLPMRWFDNQRTGDVMTRVTEDVMAMERVLIDGIEMGVVAVLQILVVGGYLFYLDPKLALITMIPMPFLIGGAWAYTKISPPRHKKVRAATSDLNSLLHDNIDGIFQIKTFTREKEEHERFNESSNILRKATLHLMKGWAVYTPSMELGRNLGYVLVLAFGAWSVMNAPDQDTLHAKTGIFVAYLVALSLFYEPISRLNGLNHLILGGRAAARRVFEILDAEEESSLDEGDFLPQPVKGHVVLDEVFFSYSKDGRTLKGVSMEALPGQMIALVGHTGAGKSTVINLLTRFYESDSGTISIDGVPISGVRKSSLRDAMGYVTQESFLFNGSVRENLALAKSDASDQEMWAALTAANATAFVEALPNGLDTNVGERGIKLSVGEKQRISIARVILKNPPILLLDEATASVDTETEKLIQGALERLMVNRTSFVIAHRLSTVRNADRIYVLENGKVIEEGDHDTLIIHDGAYAQLCRQSLMA